MFHRVLHQRLHREQRNGGAQSRVIHIDLGPQLGAQPQLLDLQIRADNTQLFFDFDQRPIGPQQVTEHVGQIQHQTPGLGIAAVDGSIQRVERIKQEMRIDLRLQSLQLGLRNQALHLNAAQLFHVLHHRGA